MNAVEKYNSWINNEYFDKATRDELLAIRDDANEIEERFYKDLEFGTAGLRGIIGAGTNRINVYTVRKATQGLANYIISRGGADRGVAIACDSRRMSPEFAQEAALCLNANGIKAYVFDALRPTPELSFAVRHLNCIAGINITASHNPANYNGYKVYWEDGAQITPPHDTGIMAEVNKITDFAEVKTMPYEDAVGRGLFITIGEAVDTAYIDALKKCVLHKDAIDKYGKDIKIVYSPLHGTGNVPVRRVLAELGFENVYVVPEQEAPDGNFPTVSYPNPEAAEAFELGLALAKEKNADLVLATDPDADRLGAWVRDSKGEYHTLTGNMSGCLIGEYEIAQKKALGILPDDGFLITTIVSTKLAKAIAKNYGTGYTEVLTGFKYIGQQILNFENNNSGSYLFGFEESYGCLIGTYARDKDAVAATMVLCEAAAFYRGQGKTLWDAMTDIYERYGYYKDGVRSVTLEGIEGLKKIQSILEGLRNDPPAEIGGRKVIAVRDYKTGIIRDTATGKEKGTGLPSANVVYFDLEDDEWVCVRPSGTEPKIKLYFGVKGDTEEAAQERAAIMQSELAAFC